MTRHTSQVEPHAASHTVTGVEVTAPVHARRPRPSSPRRLAAVCGLAAAVTATVVAIPALLRSPDTTHSTVTSANLITVTPRVPLSDRELTALVAHNPDFGSLADPKRRSSCLSALGYPGSTQVLGAQQVQIGGRAAVVLVLPGQQPDQLVALAVSPSCSSVNTGLIADTTVRRP